MDDQKTNEQRMQAGEDATYEPPVVVDYGDIFEITASAVSGPKTDVFHPGTFAPS